MKQQQNKQSPKMDNKAGNPLDTVNQLKKERDAILEKEKAFIDALVKERETLQTRINEINSVLKEAGAGKRPGRPKKEKSEKGENGISKGAKVIPMENAPTAQAVNQ